MVFPFFFQNYMAILPKKSDKILFFGRRQPIQRVIQGFGTGDPNELLELGTIRDRSAMLSPRRDPFASARDPSELANSFSCSR
jgi:hypothetical protein